MAEERNLPERPKKKLVKEVRRVSNRWSSGGEKVAFGTFSNGGAGATVDS